MISWLRHGGGEDLLNDLLKDYNCIGFAAANTAHRWADGSARKSRHPKISRTEIPCQGFCRHDSHQAWHGAAAACCRSIYPALEKGTIDAAEWVGPYDDEKLGFAKIAKYYYYPGWWEGCGQSHNIINLTKWRELPKAYHRRSSPHPMTRGSGRCRSTITSIRKHCSA